MYDCLYPTILFQLKSLYVVSYLLNSSDISPIMQILIMQHPLTQEKSLYRHLQALRLNSN